MVLGAFQDNRRSNLYIIDRDFKSKKHSYSANLYLEVLEVELDPIFEELNNGYEFIQDNASIYGASKVKEWFRNKGIRLVLNQPPYSLDLNLIEYIQQYLKIRVVEMFPDVVVDKSELEHVR